MVTLKPEALVRTSGDSFATQVAEREKWKFTLEGHCAVCSPSTSTESGRTYEQVEIIIQPPDKMVTYVQES
jgi:hypothetical protein